MEPAASVSEVIKKDLENNDVFVYMKVSQSTRDFIQNQESLANDSATPIDYLNRDEGELMSRSSVLYQKQIGQLSFKAF